MKPFEPLGQAISPEGALIKLVRRGEEYFILADGAVLMTSRTHGSEEALATLACQRARTLENPTVLIGGLGMGFTLRATLDLLPPGAAIVVAELVSAVVDWNLGPLAALAGGPLNDARVRVEIADVAATIKANPGQFDAVLLDVDNGPAAFTAPNNATLYSADGIAAIHEALKPLGVLSIWATNDDRDFERRLRTARFQVAVHHPRARLKSGGSRHTIFLARKF